jgi:hypothetical protein
MMNEICRRSSARQQRRRGKSQASPVLGPARKELAMTTKHNRVFAGIAACFATIAAASPALAFDDRWDDGDSGRHGWHRAGSPSDAVRQCSRAAERRVSRHDRADVVRILDVDRRDRGFTVRGRLAIADSGWHQGWRDGRHRQAATFRCRVEYGRVVDLDISRIRRY